MRVPQGMVNGEAARAPGMLRVGSLGCLNRARVGLDDPVGPSQFRIFHNSMIPGVIAVHSPKSLLLLMSQQKGFPALGEPQS